MNDPNLDVIANVGGWSVLAAASRAILSEDRRSVTGFFRGLVMAVFVGTMVSQLVKDYGLTPATQGAVVGIASFIADDILLFILAIVAAIRRDPKEALLNLIEYIFRGKSER